MLGAPSSMGTPKKRGVDESVLAYSPLLKSPVHVESDSELGSPSKRQRIYKLKAWGDSASSEEGSPRKGSGKRKGGGRQPMRERDMAVGGAMKKKGGDTTSSVTVGSGKGNGRGRQPMKERGTAVGGTMKKKGGDSMSSVIVSSGKGKGRGMREKGTAVGGATKKKGGKGRLVSEVFSGGDEKDSSDHSKLSKKVNLTQASKPTVQNCQRRTAVKSRKPPPRTMRQAQVSSDSEDGRGRSTKEMTRGGKGTSSQKAPAHESSSSGESGRERKTASVKEIQVTAEKWQPISQDANRVISDALLSAMGQSLEGLSGSRKRQAEQQLQGVITRVKRTLQSTRTPTCGRFKSYSTVRQRVSELKVQCLELVQANQEMEQKLEDRKRSVEEREQKVEQLQRAISSSTATPPSINLDLLPDLTQESDDDGYLNLVVDFVEKSRQSSCKQGQLTDGLLHVAH